MAGHWIGGAESAGLGAGRFEAPGPAGQLEPWPRAQAADLEAALRGLARTGAAGEWAALGDGERRRIVAAQLDTWAERGLDLPLADAGGGGELVRAHLDLEARQLATLAEELRGPVPFGALPPPAPVPGGGPAGTVPVALLFGHALLGPGRLFRLAARALAAGWPLLVVGDENLPLLAHRLGALGADLPAGLVSVLHGGLDAAWPAGLASLGAVLGALPSRQDAERWCALAQERRAAWIDLGVPAGAALDLGATLEPARAAAEVLERAFGAASLGGQLAGATVLVRAPARLYGALVEELLAHWPDANTWPRALDPGAPAARAGRLTRALDEGATLAQGDLTSGRARPAWGPALVVNAEYAPRTSAERAPLGVLLVARA
ncbi:MAG: hypothetical protein GC161_14235 [Planctomycetaceae bacterium]|nr:hypothetical protein [Planctomycetaceae bacterium]